MHSTIKGRFSEMVSASSALIETTAEMHMAANTTKFIRLGERYAQRRRRYRALHEEVLECYKLRHDLQCTVLRAELTRDAAGVLNLTPMCAKWDAFCISRKMELQMVEAVHQRTLEASVLPPAPRQTTPVSILL
jgi:hypothetical protein